MKTSDGGRHLAQHARRLLSRTRVAARLRYAGLPFRSMLFVLPSASVCGGAVKVLHYLSHARAFGVRVGLWIVNGSRAMDVMNWYDEPLHDVEIWSPQSLSQWNAIFFSLPTDWGPIAEYLPEGFSDRRILQIIQHIRHADPRFLDGYALNLLKTRLFRRLCVSREVYDAVSPLVPNRSALTTIPNAINTRVFRPPSARSVRQRLVVLYANWKNVFGDEVRDAWQTRYGKDTLVFDVINDAISQQEFSDRLRAADIFLGTPDPTEGFYLAPLEAMACRTAVICPDVIGNRSFCLPEVTCVTPMYRDLEGHVRALWRLFHDQSLRTMLARQGYSKAVSRGLWAEREEFLAFLQRGNEHHSAY